MIDVTVAVPEDRVAEFYSMYGNWLAKSEAQESPDEQLLPWTSADSTLIIATWAKFSETAKRLFSTLMDSPGTKFTGDELAGMLGISNGKHGVAGLLGWPGRHCLAVNREWLWDWDYPEGGNARYWATEEISALFSRARKGSL